MKKIVLGLVGAAATMAAGAAMAQPYGYARDYDRPVYGQAYGYDRGYDRGYVRDSDRDGIPDRAEWNRDRDHDGRPDQYDRYDNRRDRHHRHHRYDRDARYYDRGVSYTPYVTYDRYYR